MTAFDPALIQRGARLKRSPYFEATEQAGCKSYTAYNHMLLPTRYDDFEAEYQRLLGGVTLWDVAVERNVEISGPDGGRFAELLTPRDLSKCAIGQGRYVLLTDDAGGIGWTGELGYELYLLDPARGVDLWNRIMDAGRPFGLTPTGPSDIRRVEAGIFNYGIDMTLENNPYELGLERLVDLDKPADFIGRDALKKIQSQGVNKRLVGVEIAGVRLEFNMTRWPVRAAGQPLGHVTSALYSPRLKKNIGYAWVPSGWTKTGTKLEVVTPDGVRAATVVPMPFIDPKKTLAKS